jgi:hypothetical protein
METLRKAAQGGALGDIVGNSGELASELAGVEDELNTLTASVADFTVIPTYNTVEAEVTRLQSADPRAEQPDHLRSRVSRPIGKLPRRSADRPTHWPR